MTVDYVLLLGVGFIRVESGWAYIPVAGDLMGAFFFFSVEKENHLR